MSRSYRKLVSRDAVLRAERLEGLLPSGESSTRVSVLGDECWFMVPTFGRDLACGQSQVPIKSSISWRTPHEGIDAPLSNLPSVPKTPEFTFVSFGFYSFSLFGFFHSKIKVGHLFRKWGLAPAQKGDSPWSGQSPPVPVPIFMIQGARQAVRA